MSNVANAATSDVRARILRTFIIGFGFCGAAFIAYGIVAQVTGEFWPPIERIAEPLSSGLAIVGTMIVCLSIYFESGQTPPEPHSIYFTAPFIILIAVIALGALILKGALPIVVVNGFAILGLSGALQRIQPNPNMRPQSN